MNFLELLKAMFTSVPPYTPAERVARMRSGEALPVARTLAADGPARLEENDPTAKTLGYKRDTTKVDWKKYPQHKPDQKCTGCLLCTGKPDGVECPCGAFAGKLVAAPGWCMVYAKKP